jgi:predicted O-methyltransferase YrrM
MEFLKSGRFIQRPEPGSDVTDKWQHYTTLDDAGAPEVEVLELIYSLVRATKPMIAVELGTYHGASAACIAEALMVNEMGGVLHTYEVDPMHLMQAQANLQVFNNIFFHQQSSRIGEHIWYEGNIDFLFVDAAIEDRVDDFFRWWKHMNNGGIAVLHDTLKFDPPYSQLKHITAKNINLKTPRGVTIVSVPPLGGESVG